MLSPGQEAWVPGKSPPLFPVMGRIEFFLQMTPLLFSESLLLISDLYTLPLCTRRVIYKGLQSRIRWVSGMWKGLPVPNLSRMFPEPNGAPSDPGVAHE